MLSLTVTCNPQQWQPAASCRRVHRSGWHNVWSPGSGPSGSYPEGWWPLLAAPSGSRQSHCLRDRNDKEMVLYMMLTQQHNLINIHTTWLMAKTRECFFFFFECHTALPVIRLHQGDMIVHCKWLWFILKSRKFPILNILWLKKS